MLTRIHEQRHEHDKSPILSAPATPKVLSTVSYFPLFIKKEQLPLTYDSLVHLLLLLLCKDNLITQSTEKMP